MKFLRQVLPPARAQVGLDPGGAQEGRVAGAGGRGRIQEKGGEVQRLYSAIQQASEKQAFEKVRQLSDHLAKTQAALEQSMVEWEKLAR